MNGDQENVNKSQGMENTIEVIDLTAEDDDVDVQDPDDDATSEVMSTHSSLEGINSDTDSSDDETAPNERPIKCRKCGCNYERLLGHECRLLKPLFPCPLCGYKLIGKEYLKRHFVNVHGIDDDAHLATDVLGLDLSISEQKIKSEPLVEKALSTQIGSSNSRATTMKIGEGEEKRKHDEEDTTDDKASIHSSLDHVSSNSPDSSDSENDLNFHGFSPRPMKCEAKKPAKRGRPSIEKGPVRPRIECRKCLRTFSSKGNLTQHLKRECKIAPTLFPCVHCDYRTMNKWHLEKHLVKSHNVHRSQLPGSDFYKTSYPFKCDDCLRTYKRREGLRRHVEFECGVGPAFPCPLCAHQTTQKYNLRYHLLNVHKVERSQLPSYEIGPTFKCTICPFRAKLKTDLLAHVEDEHNRD